MKLVFYTAPNSSAVPVAIVLKELDVPHERVVFDLARKDQKKPEFLELNPNGKVPTLVVDGTPMFEACAIMQWLGDRFGVERGLWPAFDDPARLRALSWSTWAYVSYLQALLAYHAANDPAGGAPKNPAEQERVQAFLDEHMEVLDQHLGRHRFMLGDSFSIVDLIVAGCAAYGQMLGVSLDRYERIGKWVASCTSRPSFRSEWG